MGRSYTLYTSVGPGAETHTSIPTNQRNNWEKINQEPWQLYTIFKKHRRRIIEEAIAFMSDLQTFEKHLTGHRVEWEKKPARFCRDFLKQFQDKRAVPCITTGKKFLHKHFFYHQHPSPSPPLAPPPIQIYPSSNMCIGKFKNGEFIYQYLL